VAKGRGPRSYEHVELNPPNAAVQTLQHSCAYGGDFCLDCACFSLKEAQLAWVALGSGFCWCVDIGDAWSTHACNASIPRACCKDPRMARKIARVCVGGGPWRSFVTTGCPAHIQDQSAEVGGGRRGALCVAVLCRRPRQLLPQPTALVPQLPPVTLPAATMHCCCPCWQTSWAVNRQT
jgi:hypothetical protein